jgi:predicted ATPase
VDLEIIEPNPFTVFIGPNGSGKSNIFEALEFFISTYPFIYGKERIRLFGGIESIQSRLLEENIASFFCESDLFESGLSISYETGKPINQKEETWRPYDQSIEDSRIARSIFLQSFSRIFINNNDKQKMKFEDGGKLNFSASNLEKVLKRILQDESKREEILEILQLLVPELENIEVYSDNISGQDTLLIKEKNTKKPFGKSLISDGTYNILCLLTAVYQSDEPQFLCIEEPENGLSPYAIELLVELMRNKCKEKGHYIWLNTHSPTLVRQLQADELILVDKKDGATQIKQLKGKNFHGLSMDEAWLTNALGGGLPW